MKFLRRLDYWLHRDEREAELSEELEFHRSMSDPARMGNATLAREDARAVWIWPWLESVFQDLAYALRSLRGQPGFAAVVLLTLGAAIGLNTSFFTVFDAVAFRSWAVRDPARVVKLMSQPVRGGHLRGFSLAEFRYFTGRAKSLSGIAAMGDDRVHLGFEGFGKTSYAMFVSGNYFETLGVALDRGRGFIPEENVLDAPVNVAVLSYPLWCDHFGADPAIVGQQIHVDEIPFTVVGVASEEFSGTTGGREDLWIPLPAMQSLRPNEAGTREFLRSPNDCCSWLAGRLAPGSSRAQAQAELAVLSRQFHDQYQLDPARVVLADPTILAGHPKRRNFLPVFGLMFVGLTLVLLLACANVSNLLIARAAARQREIEVRRALGAGRARIVRQLLTEGLVLALGASALGVALAWKLPAYVFALAGDGPNVRLTPDATVILYAAALAALTCIGFALAPALHSTGVKSGRKRLPLRDVLLAAQIAMSVVLLIGAGLMLAAVKRAHEQDPGFRIHGVSVISFELPASSYNAKRTSQFSAELLNQLKGSPQMPALAIAVPEPLAHAYWNTSFRLPGEPAGTEHNIDVQKISPDYFDLLDVPIVAGRNFMNGDEARHLIVINQSMAKRYFADTDPLGKSVIVDNRTREIVGVARDAALTYIEGVGPLFFEPFTGEQIPTLLVRSSVPGAVDLVSAVVKRIDPRARVQSAPLSENLDRQLEGSRVMAGIAGMLGALALALAAVGVSGVFAYVVQQRTKEIGIRMALGAPPKQVIVLVLAGTARAAIIGLAIGYVAAAGFAKFLAQYLYGVSPYDPRAYLEVAAILAISGLAAAFLPARRAVAVDPLNALRIE